MTDYTTIRVSKAAKESAQEAKRDGETWNEYLQRCTDTPPNVQEFVPVEEVVGREVPQSNLEQDTDALRHQLERNYEAIKEATNAAEGAKRTVENLR